MELRDFIVSARKRRGLTQEDLAKLSGLSRSYISRLETEVFDNISVQSVLALAKALKVKPDEIYHAAGFIGTNKFIPPPKRPEDLLAELEIAMPIAIPVVADIHAGPSDALDYVYWARTQPAPKNLKALKVKGFCMSPLIEEGDVLIVNPDIVPVASQSIVVCHNDGEIWLKKFGEHGECQIYGVVIGINRKL